MEHRYNYFQQNPNSFVNGQSAFNRPSTDVIQSTNNYSGSIPSTSPSDQSPFHEKIHSNPNAVPLMNNHLYQMDSVNQAPRSSGPPRTNAKGIYENSQSSIPNVLSLAQTNNAENYTINPDFQLQPHLTALLPQQSKRVPELYPVAKYNNSKGSIAENMNTNYFSSNKPYPEPNIIEYDMEETSTESSPQHTSSLYSESTDQDSESTHPTDVFLRHTISKSTECHVTKESKTITTSNHEFPVPSQFADLSLKKNGSVDDHQHSILHSVYNQDDDDIIEDIPLFDNINQNERQPSLENQENLESRCDEQSVNMPRAQTFDSYTTKKDIEQTQFNYENKQSSSSSIYNSITNYLSNDTHKSSNIQNASQFNKGLYFSQTNTLTQHSSSNSSMLQHSQSKPLFPYGNTELFNHQQASLNVQNYNYDHKSEHFNQQNQHIQPDIQNSNVPPIDSKLQSNVNSNTQDKIVLNQTTLPVQVLNYQNSQSMNSCATNLFNHQNEQGIESISQQSIYNSSKSPIPELLNNSKPIASQEFIACNSSLISTQSLGPVTSAIVAAPSRSLFSVSETVVQDNQHTQHQKSEDDQASNILNLSNAAKNSPIDSLNQDSSNIISEFDIKLSQSPINNILENRPETTVDQSKPIQMQFNEDQHNEEKLLSPPSFKNVTQSNDFFNPNSMTSQLEINNQQLSRNQLTPKQSITDDNLKISSDQFSNKPINIVSQSINNQNVTVQQSIPTTGHSFSNYFDSSNVNNTFMFNQQSCNLQSNNQLQNMQTQDKPNVSIDPTSDKSNNCMIFSNAQNTSVKLLSSNQQPLLMKNELEIYESLKLDSDVLSEEILHSSEPVLTQTNNFNFESLENAKLLTPNNQFSKMTIDKQHSISDNKVQEQSTPTSYFSKDISLDKEEHSIAFQNFSTTLHDNNSLKPKLSDINTKSQSLPSKQTNLPSLNSDLPLNNVSPLSISNQIVPDNKPVGQLEANQFPPQHFSNKVTSNDISSTSNQLPPQMFDNQPKSNTIQPLQSASNLYTTQPFNNQPTSNAVSFTSNQSNQIVPDNKPVDLLEANHFPPQHFSNKVTSNDISSTSDQLPPQMFDNQPKSNTIQPLQSASNLYTTQPFNNQPTSNAVSFTSNQFPPKMFGNQLKSGNIQPLQTPTILNQPIPSTNPSISMASNQLPTQIFNHQPISDTIQHLQSSSNPCTTQPFDNKLFSTTIPSVSNRLPPQMFSNQPASNTVLPTQFASSSCPTPIVSTATNQLPPSMFSNQSTTDTVPPLQPASNLHSTQVFSNQSKPVTVPSNQPSLINQFSPKILTNQPKSMAIPHNQTAAKSFINQSTPSTAWPVSSATNQFQQQTFNSQVKSDVYPPQTLSNQYASQPFNNKTISNMIPNVPSATSQLPSQIINNQPKSNVALIQSTTGQYPFQPFNNQNTPTTVSSVVNQLPPQLFSNQPKPNVVPPLQPSSNQYNLQAPNNQQTPNFIPPVSTTVNQFPPQMLTNQPRLDPGSSNKLTASQYQSQPLINQSIPGIPPIQQATNQYQSQPFNHQSKPSNFPPSQTVKNQYPSQPFNEQPGQQVLPKQNIQQSSSNQFYNQSSVVQPGQNQWPPANFSSQPNLMSSQPITVNSASNLPTLPPNVNQQSQRLGTHMLPPNSFSINNYPNQVGGNVNVQQPQSSSQNVQLASKGYPPQSNMGFPSQINYQQPNALHGQQGFHNQQQDQYKPEQNPSVVQQGFAKTWGYDNLDLLKSRDVLPGDGVQPPEIKLPQGYANCDNCSPDIFRCTLNKFPSSKNLLDKSRLPLGILIHPYKDLSRLTVIQCETITRCRNCRSYINPFVQFIDNAHWKCNLCYRVNELPGEFQIDPYTKTLGDPSRRPEIQNATIEYIASQDYMVRPPQPALYLFLLDVSRTATLTGYLEIVCDRILNKIMADDIPGDSRTNIGFITFDSSVHFYQIANSDGGQPKQLIVSDISEIFLPLPDGLMVNLEENKTAIKDLLTSLPNNYRESYNTGCALGAALQAAFKILAPRGGRVTVFQASLPNCGPGSLESRDDGNPHTGDRVQHMAPSTDFYKKLALECSGEQIAVDMFFVSSQYLDVATISGISKYSSGCIHNFPQFDVKSPTIVTRFINCFDRYLTRKIGFEALLRLRCTRGVAIHSFHGNFFVRSSDLLMLPNVNPDNAYGMQLSIEDSLDGVSVVCFQAALLYTSSNAERRIRVHTLCIPVTENLDDVFHNADQQAITCLIAKMAVDRSTEKSLSDAREAFFNAISDSLSAFKLGCSSYNGPGTMLSPLSLKVFPLYILATLKHAAFRTNQPTRLDERMFSMCQMKSLPVNNLIQYIYPDLYPIYALEEQPKIDYEKLTEIPLPPVIQLSAERVESNGVYLMDDSETLTIFIGHRCSDQLIQQLFGYVNVNSMPELITTLAEVDSKPSYLLRSFISYLQHFKPYPLPIEIIKDNGPHKLRFYSRLIEDKFESSLSYYEFLQRLSQQVR